MIAKQSNADNTLKRGLLLSVLLLSTFLVTAGISFFSTLLPDIASSFKVSIGTASTLGVVVSTAGLIVALVMGALTIRFKHKSLYLVGVITYSIGALGLFFSQNLGAAILAMFFDGAGRAMISIMVLSLIGGLFPLEKRGWAIGLTVSASFTALVFVPFLSASIAQVAGWRSFLLCLSLPLSIACIPLGLFAIPSKPRQQQAPAHPPYLEAFKQILLNKSAIACVVGATLLALASVVAVYAVSFFRINFAVPLITAGVFGSVVAAGGVFGGTAGGRLINRVGRKPLTVVPGLLSGIAILLFTFVSNVWVSMALWAVSATTAAIAGVGLTSLTIEQVPGFKASMMSMHQTFEFLGSILGIVIGTVMLNLYANNFQLLMTLFGASGIALAPIVLLLARDPCKPKCPSKHKMTSETNQL